MRVMINARLFALRVGIALWASLAKQNEVHKRGKGWLGQAKSVFKLPIYAKREQALWHCVQRIR